MSRSLIAGKSNDWIGDFHATISEALNGFIGRHLRKDLYSRFGDEILQDVGLLLVVKKDSPEFAGIDASNWRTAERLRFLRGWAFNAARLLTYKRIRESQRYDHGGTRFDILAVATDGAVHEEDEKSTDLLAECPVRGASVFERLVLTGATDAKLAEELGISEVGVRVIRFRIRKWLQQRRVK